MLIITAIMVLIFDSGFVDEMDESVNKRFPLRHIPKPFSCVLCMTFWSNILFLIITHNLTLPYIMLSLLFAKGTGILTNAVNLIETAINKILELLMRLIA